MLVSLAKSLPAASYKSKTRFLINFSFLSEYGHGHNIVEISVLYIIYDNYRTIPAHFLSKHCSDNNSECSFLWGA